MLAPAPRLSPLVVLHPQCPAARLLTPHTAVAASHAPHTLPTRSSHGSGGLAGRRGQPIFGALVVA